MYIRGEMLLVLGVSLLLSPFALKGVELEIHKSEIPVTVAVMNLRDTHFQRVSR